MKRWLLGVAAAWSLVGCAKDGPLNVYYDMATAAEFGDVDGFLAGFTKESRQLIQAQLSLSEAYGLKNDNPVTMLVFPVVEGVKIEGDSAILDVARKNVRRQIKMVNVPEEGWRIDVRVLGDFWANLKKGKQS